MSKRIFNKEHIATLLLNKNVAKCSERSISYRKDFKISAVRQHQEGLPPKEIFRQAGFDMYIIGQKTPKYCLSRWRKLCEHRGITKLHVDGRGRGSGGGRPKSLKNLTEKEKLRRLEAEVAYLKKENRFLAKLRKQSLN